MSGGGGEQFPSVDNLTPFEYALAGVDMADSNDSPSLAVIEQMRQLAAEIADAPVTQPRLNEFLQAGGTVARRSERRSLRRRRATPAADNEAEGGFIDITPAELTDDKPDNTLLAVPPRPADDGTGTGIAITGAVAGTGSILGDDVDVAGQEPTAFVETNELAEQAGDGDPVATSDATATDDHPAGLDGLGTDPIEPDVDQEELAELEAVDAQFDAIQAALRSELDEPGDPDRAETAAARAPGDDEITVALEDDDGPDQPVEVVPSGYTEPVYVFDDGSTVALADSSDGDRDGSHDGSEDELGRPLLLGGAAAAGAAAIGGALAGDQDETGTFDRRDEAGRFTEEPDPALAARPALFGDPDEEDGTAVLVPAAGAGPNLFDDEDDGVTAAAAPIQLAAATAAVPITKRRFAGAFWALAGTATAAAVLAVGGLWWANGLSESTETESADGQVVDDRGQDGSDPAGAERSEAGGGDGGGDDGSGGASDAPDSNDSSDNTQFGASERSTTTERTTTTRSSTETTRTTGQTSTTTGRTSTTAGSSTTTTDEPSSSTTASSTSSTASTTTEPTSTTTTTRPTTTRPPTTTTTTTRPTTTTAVQLAYIGDEVNVGDFGGPGAANVRVQLFADDNRDGQPDRLVETTTTDSDGRYSFDVPGQCYVLDFLAPDGFRMAEGYARQTICVSPGGVAARMDGIVLADSRPPSGCKVEPPGSQSWRGVEVYENEGDWAESYTFYNRNGQVVVRTRDLGPADDVEGSTNREWHARSNGFDHRAVRSVAAERNGYESDPVTCQRESEDDD